MSEDVLTTTFLETLNFLDECDSSWWWDSWLKLPFDVSVCRCDDELC
jgi:hypothetical protein